MAVDGPAAYNSVVGIDSAHKLIARIDLAWKDIQDLKQFKLYSREAQFALFEYHTIGILIQNEAG